MPYKDKAKSAAWYAANKDEVAAYQKAWKAANPEKVKEYAKAYTASSVDRRAVYKKAYDARNKEVKAAKSRAYYAANKEKHAAHMKAYYEANKDKLLADGKKYFAQNKDRFAARNARRRVTKSQRTVAWADQQAIAEVYKRAAALGMHVDHIVPLQGKLVSGLHVPHNLQLLPACENVRKGAKFDPDAYVHELPQG